MYPKNWTAEAYPGKDAATGSKPPGQQVLTLICRPSWQTRRFGSLCATDIFSAAKGRVLRSFISRSVSVIGEKSRDLKPAFVFFTKQQKGVWGLRSRRKRGLGHIAPNPVFVSEWVAVVGVKTLQTAQIATNLVFVDFLSSKLRFDVF